MRQTSKFLSFAFFLAIRCGAQDYCGLLAQPTAVGANPPSHTADQILRVLSDTAPFNYSTINLKDARDPDLKTQGAAAQVCNINQRWIFYDPDFIEKIRTNGQSDWPKYFIFAHEVAHHFNNDPQDHHRDQELQADRAAAHWLTSIGASVQNLVDSINSFVSNESRELDYPSRCDRVSGVIHAYNEEATIINGQGGNKVLYDVGDCKPISSGGGLFTTKVIESQAMLETSDVQTLGLPPSNAYLPLDFKSDLDGMCAVARLNQSERLTWDKIGVCALMKGH